MSSLERGRVLLEQDRYKEAQKELALAISEDPDNSFPHCLLALCDLNLGQKKQGLAHAERAVSMDPDFPYAHYVLAIAYSELEKHKLAEKAIRAALEIDPYDADYYGALSAILGQQSRWKDSLEAAELGLKEEPDHLECTRLRAQALSFLGKRSEARETAAKAIEIDPDAPHAHTSLGWVNLRQGDHKAAAAHFGDALRMDPQDEDAREGLLEALRSRFPPYRWVFAFYYWVARFPETARWGIFIALILGNRVLRAVAKNNPEWMPLIIPVVVVIGTIIWFGWIGEPLVNVSLLMHPLGKMALTPVVRRETYVIGAFIALTLVFLTLGFVFSRSLGLAAIPAVTVLLLALATKVHSSPKLRAGLHYGIAVLGGIGLVVGSIVVSRPPAG